MRKTLVLVLALWAGCSNFAYASARLECAAMMQRASCHAMPQPAGENPCPCKIQAPTDHRVVGDVFFLQTDPPVSALRSDVPVFSSEGSSPAFFGWSHGPPPGIPLFTLFSVYRI